MNFPEEPAAQPTFCGLPGDLLPWVVYNTLFNWHLLPALTFSSFLSLFLKHTPTVAALQLLLPPREGKLPATFIVAANFFSAWTAYRGS